MNELILKANFLHNESEELKNNLNIISQQVEELIQFDQNISSLKDVKNKELISSIGKGVFVKTSMQEKEFFVEVGSGIVVKKTLEETKKAISAQIKKLNDVKVHLSEQVAVYEITLQDLIKQISKNN